MIKSFKHKRLNKFFTTGKASGLNRDHVKRLRIILGLLNTAHTIEGLNLPGLNLHELIGSRKGTYSVKVSGNWRVTFKLKDGEWYDIDYEDYH